MNEESTPSNSVLSKAERQARRLERKKQKNGKGASELARKPHHDDTKGHLLSQVSMNEAELLRFMVKVNKLYEEKLHKAAPFMTWVLIGMQSSGKSTFMERLLNAVLNIVQEGTGTRCPLDVTCINDENCSSPVADLSGVDLQHPGTSLSVEDVFERITNHNKQLDEEDKFSTNSLKLVYRADNVVNMRFVDTPGIISNKSTGKDNRDAIKDILRTEISKPNTKLCVLLEATEYSKNPIINFLDESLDGRQGWFHNSKFLMPKFDKQAHDSRTANKANVFFSEFVNNEVYPHLVITPTLEREDLETAALFKKRNELLAKSNQYESSQFDGWLSQHQQFREGEGSEEVLNHRIKEMIGFQTAQESMKNDMLEHTLATLPEVIGSLRRDLAERKAEHQVLKEKKKFTDPGELKAVVTDMLHCLQERVAAYLDGDLTASLKYSDKLQTLEDEIDAEEESLWYEKELDFHLADEERWRTQISEMNGTFPETIQPDNRFLGGKQVHRAIEFFGVVLIDSLPDPKKLEDIVPNAVGYGSGGLMRENWEGATRQICKTLMEDITHPGINYLVKHIGFILQRLFQIALVDIMTGQEGSKTFRLVPDSVKDFLVTEFDKMLWDLMTRAAKNVHTAMKPFYATIDPNLPTFMASDNQDGGDENEEDAEKDLLVWAKDKLKAAFSGSSSEAKKMLKEQNKARAERKKGFLRDKRTSMVNSEEISLIVNRSFQYLVALMEFCMIVFRLQINCYLYEEFKLEMKKTFSHKASEAAVLVKPDPSIEKRMSELEEEMEGLESSLREVERMNRKL